MKYSRNRKFLFRSVLLVLSVFFLSPMGGYCDTISTNTSNLLIKKEAFESPSKQYLLLSFKKKAKIRALSCSTNPLSWDTSQIPNATEPFSPSQTESHVRSQIQMEWPILTKDSKFGPGSATLKSISKKQMTQVARENFYFLEIDCKFLKIQTGLMVLWDIGIWHDIPRIVRGKETGELHQDFTWSGHRFNKVILGERTTYFTGLDKLLKDFLSSWANQLE